MRNMRNMNGLKSLGNMRNVVKTCRICNIMLPLYCVVTPLKISKHSRLHLEISSRVRQKTAASPLLDCLLLKRLPMKESSLLE